MFERRLANGLARATAALLALLLVLAAPLSQGRGGSGQDPASGNIGIIALAELPPEARETIAHVRRGGPFRYERDGTVFRNFERLLPIRPRGYYREYTVATPWLKHRGARRIIAGGGGELYYTDDHYRSFRRVRE